MPNILKYKKTDSILTDKHLSEQQLLMKFMD